MHLTLRISVLPQSTIFGIAKKFRPPIRANGHKYQVTSDEFIDAGCCFIGHDLTAGSKPSPFDDLFVWS